MNDSDGLGGKPEDAAGKPGDATGKPDDMKRLEQEALEAGAKFVATDTGRQVADATDAAFAKAEELRQRALASELGQKALASDFGRQASNFAADASAKVKEAIPNTLGRNMAVGAAAGVVLTLPVPIVGWLVGAIVGAGIGYLRTVTKKS